METNYYSYLCASIFVVGKKSEYEIGFTSLQDGKHDYHYKIEDTFFEQFDYSDIEGANLNLDAVLEKSPNMITVDFKTKGTLKVMCDRCTDSFDLPIAGEDDVIYKFSDQEIDDEKILTIAPNEVKIDLTAPIYEFISLLLPSRRVHPEGECNEEMLKEIDNYLMVESDDTADNHHIKPDSDQGNDDDDEIDPRWAQLKNLK